MPDDNFPSKPAGCRIWAIADGYIPEESHGPQPEMLSHETASILNTGDMPARIELVCYFEDREPLGPVVFSVPARRTVHQRFNDIREPEPLPRGTGYSCVIKSDVPVVVQQTRLDSRQSRNALISTIAHPLGNGDLS